ncbi:tyrosine-type recombinase/integrase [Acinetobacter baumannii]|nr:tyrosine-type recombinase/integrase [Acinetobacter baumannii]
MSLAEKTIRNARPKDKTYFLSDDNGLSLKIDPKGQKSWCYRFIDDVSRKRRRVVIGKYPELSLKDARSKRDHYFSQSKHESEKTFSEVANEWLDHKSAVSFYDTPRSGVLDLAAKCLKNDIFPYLGTKKFNEIRRYDLIQVIKRIESRNVREPAKKACSYLNQIYEFAILMGYCELNLSISLHKIITNKSIKKNYPYLKANELSNFLKRLKEVKAHPIIKKAILFKLYTGVRGSELLSMELKQIDFEKKIWCIPAINIKQHRRKVLMGYEVPDFLVPLSSQAFELLQKAIQWSLGEKYIFSSPINKDKPLHFNTINYVLRKMGYSKYELTAHGFRSTFSTILNESGLFQESWIEAQLSHVDKNRTRSSYNHADYLSQRKEMMEWWGQYILSKF